MAKKHPIVHVEYRTRDTHRLQHFYTSVFGWKFDEAMPGYAMFDSGNKEVAGGVMQLTPESHGMQPGVSNYLGVKSLEESEAKVVEHGGKVLMARQAVPGMGHFTVFTDVDGNVLGMWQPLGKKEQKAAAKAEKQARKAAKKEKKEQKKAKKKSEATA
jgi:predicted enzyme related to lactoylglutathione lyase